MGLMDKDGIKTNDGNLLPLHMWHKYYLLLGFILRYIIINLNRHSSIKDIITLEVHVLSTAQAQNIWWMSILKVRASPSEKHWNCQTEYTTTAFAHLRYADWKINKNTGIFIQINLKFSTLYKALKQKNQKKYYLKSRGRY